MTAASYFRSNNVLKWVRDAAPEPARLAAARQFAKEALTARAALAFAQSPRAICFRSNSVLKWVRDAAPEHARLAAARQFAKETLASWAALAFAYSPRVQQLARLA